GKLRREDLAGLEGLATRAEWDDPTNLDAFMKETDAPEAFSIAGDAESRTRLRVKEVELLGTGGPDRAAKVAEYLSDGAPEVRATALRVIAASRAREQAPKVATLLRDKRS